MTVANLAATQLTQISPITTEESSKPYLHRTLDGEPPPECPMHKPKTQPQVSKPI